MVAAIVLAGAVINCALGLTDLYGFRSGIYDMVIFDQGVRGYANLTGPLSDVKGNWETPGVPFSLLGDHFSPILALIAPLYRLHDGPETLIVAQAALFALAVVPLWSFTRRALGTSAAYFFAIAYVISWPIAEAVVFDFHEYAFVPLLTALVFERIQAGKTAHALISSGALLAVKEDIGILVAGLGVGFMLTREHRKPGIVLLCGGLLQTFVATQVVIPAFGGGAGRYWYYSGLGGTLPDAAIRILTHPGDALHVLVTPGAKVWTVLLLIGPLLCLPLFSPYAFAALSLLALRMLATDQGAAGWWGTGFHYNSAVVMALLCAAVDGLARLRRRVRHPILRLPGRYAPQALMVAMLATVPFFPFSNLVSPAWYRTPARAPAAEAAMATIPDGVLVETANTLGPHITSRTRVVAWAAKTAARPQRAPWVLADLIAKQPHFPSIDAQATDVADLVVRGYREVFSSDGYAVLCAPEACVKPHPR
ncbi:hypothetical protein DP939_26600 [Spongiactinospora rosea]|uniref:DUF2079 domain-containing protein n=1 Tax=Spongiactinospora rosea TaxID=2248750 RepID=A0A366LT16_9ACTN|nr:DUF2079 domain-containing protein [Spongiactinospora rosea]RBQ17061.1 hypothetical protein DP939_26600 [Spongiactinospora rosea]